MVRTFERRLNWSRSFRKMFEGALGKQTAHSSLSDHKNDTSILAVANSRSDSLECKAMNPEEKKQTSDMELMKERFAKLLLGEDMSGGGNSVSSALALSNAFTNLAASIFGEQAKLEPVSLERKAKWRKEIDWLLSVTDHVVEFVPSQQLNKDGVFTEIMVTKQRADLHMNVPALCELDNMLMSTLDNFRGQNEFWYVSRQSEGSEKCKDQKEEDDKWWLHTVIVAPCGLSEESRRWLHYQKDSVTQVLKAAMAIKAQVLSEMDIPESYIESLPKNGKSSLGDFIYRSITEDYFDPDHFLSALDLSTESKVLDLKNRIEASIVIWKRKMIQKDGKSSWGSAVSLEKRELFEERAETVLLLLKQQFPGIPQSALDKSKIQFNKDVGRAILESYSRILETLAFKLMSGIEDVLYADSLAQKASTVESDGKSETERESTVSSESGQESEKLISVETPNSSRISNFMGWNLEYITTKHSSKGDVECYYTAKNDKAIFKSPKATPKKFSYLEKLENLRIPTERH